MNLFTSKTAKVFAGLVTLALAFAFVVTPVTSKAATADELTAQINALLAQIAALQGQVGGSTSGSYTFSTDLTIGSTGADVTALQNILISGGYLNLPAGVAKGYFGSLTASAVKAWQASAGISATGYVGPISRAKLNSMGGSTGGSTGTYPAGCTSNTGFSSTTGMSCAGSTSFPAGCTSAAGFSTTTGMSCSGTGTTMNGTDGSVTLSYVSYAPASQTLKKGDTNKPVISVKLQAVNGQVAVTRFDVHFSERPWLDFGSVTLTDSTGAVLATKTLSGASDVTEVTVGSDYLVRFDNVNIPVTPGTDKILAVAVNVLAASDKITGQTVYAAIPTGSIRTINGKGYTDSVGLGSTSQGGAVNSSYGNSVVLSSTGSTGTLYTRIDPSSPSSNRTVVTSASNVTSNVILGVFSVKSQNQAGTLNGMSLTFQDGNGPLVSNLYSNVRVQAAGLTYGSNALATTTTFTNMSIPLPVDAWVPLTIIADVQSGITGVSASTTLVASALTGVDTNYNTLTLSSATNQSSTNNVYSTSGINVTPISAVLSNCGSSYASGPTDNCAMVMKFKVENAGSATIFISKTPGIALSTSSNPSTASTSLSAFTQMDVNGNDTTASYAVTGGNTTREFTVSGRFGRPAGLGFETFSIAAVKFGTVATDGSPDNGSQNTTASSNTASVVNYGLTTLQAQY